jgi:hypothetical protein
VYKKAELYQTKNKASLFPRSVFLNYLYVGVALIINGISYFRGFRTQTMSPAERDTPSQERWFTAGSQTESSSHRNSNLVAWWSNLDRDVKFKTAILQLCVLGRKARKTASCHYKMIITANDRSTLPFAAESSIVHVSLPDPILWALTEKRKYFFTLHTRFRSFEMERHWKEYQTCYLCLFLWACRPLLEFPRYC